MTRAGRRHLRSASLLASSIVASLALGECALRAVRPQPLGFYWLSEDGLPLHVPGLVSVFERDEFRVEVRINSEGFRGAEFAIPKPSGTYRILALGDSFTEGLQVAEHETLTARMERALTTSERPVEVWNLGVSGYGTADALALLRARGERFDPDLVLLVFCLANDVRNNLASPLCREEGGRVVCGQPERPSPRRLAYSRLRAEIAARSHLFQLVHAAAEHPLFVQLGLRAPELQQITAGRPFGRDQYRDPPPEYIAEGLELTGGILTELRDTAAALGAETWIVLVPVREQIWDREWNAIVTSDTQPGTLVRDQLQRAVSRVARDAGLPVVDLYDAFRAHDGGAETLFWTIDAHFDAQGHALAASEIVAALRARDLPPVATP